MGRLEVLLGEADPALAECPPLQVLLLLVPHQI